MTLDKAKALVRLDDRIHQLQRARTLATNSEMFYEAVYSDANREIFQTIAKALDVSPSRLGMGVAASLIERIDEAIKETEQEFAELIR